MSLLQLDFLLQAYKLRRFITIIENSKEYVYFRFFVGLYNHFIVVNYVRNRI
jgi:hypothetical protein